MTGLKSLFMALFAVLVIGEAARLSFEDEYVKSFLKGIQELERHSHHLEDLLTSPSEAKETVSGSKEELEDDKGLTDASASQENTKEETTKKPDEGKEEKKPEEVDDDDDDDDSLEDAFFPARGGLGGIFDIPTIFGITRTKSWWSGPNVCVEREEKEEKSEDAGPASFISFGVGTFATCQSTPAKYFCKTVTTKNGVTKTELVTYQCCHGFRRTMSSPTCTKVETRPIFEIAADLGSDKFADMIKSTGLESELEGNVTVFLPTDAVLSNHHEDMDSMNQIDPLLTNEVPPSSNSGPRDEKSFVLGHVVEGVYEVSNLEDEQVLKTKDDSTLRVSILPNRVVTVNCVKLNATDHLTQNGVVHLVDSVLQPVKENLAEKLSEPRFSRFKELLEENDLWDLMSGEKGITVFAVENEGVEKILGKYNMCMRNILAHHILPHTLCSATAESSEQLATLDLAKNWLPFSKKDDQMIIGNSTKVTSVDNIATNGILHVAEAFVIPSSSRMIPDLLNQTGHTEWLKVLEKSGLLSKIETTENMTMFVPTDSAVKEAISDDLSQSDLEELVKFHIGTDQKGNMVSTMLDGNNLTISKQKGVMVTQPFGTLSVQCVPLTRLGGRVCNGLLHEVESVLKPPKQSLWEFVQSHEKLSTLKKVLEGTEFSDEMKKGFEFTPTFLAPTDEAFDEISQENLDTLLKDKSLADQILRSHLVKEPVCCSNVVASTWWPFIPASMSLSGQTIEINRRGQSVSFGSLPVTDCDNMVKGGIVHLVNGVRLARNRPRDRELILRRPNTEIILAGI